MESALNFKNSMACYVHWYDCFGWVFRAEIFPVSQLSGSAASCLLMYIRENKYLYMYIIYAYERYNNNMRLLVFLMNKMAATIGIFVFD